MSDHELLQSYVQDGSEAAFAKLVERHLNLVYSAARRMVRDPHLAQDVTQEVFTLLARKAGKLGRGTILSAWLYRAARRFRFLNKPAARPQPSKTPLAGSGTACI